MYLCGRLFIWFIEVKDMLEVTWWQSLVLKPLCLFCLFVWPYHETWGILVSWPGIKPGSPEVEAQSPNCWTTRWSSYVCLECDVKLNFKALTFISSRDKGISFARWVWICSILWLGKSPTHTFSRRRVWVSPSKDRVTSSRADRDIFMAAPTLGAKFKRVPEA